MPKFLGETKMIVTRRVSEGSAQKSLAYAAGCKTEVQRVVHKNLGMGA